LEIARTTFSELHELHKNAIRNGQIAFAHEIVSEIYHLLNIEYTKMWESHIELWRRVGREDLGILYAEPPPDTPNYLLAIYPGPEYITFSKRASVTRKKINHSDRAQLDRIREQLKMLQ
jgi:hypothetical protein